MREIMIGGHVIPLWILAATACVVMLGLFIALSSTGGIVTIPEDPTKEQLTFASNQWGPSANTTVPWIMIKVMNTGPVNLSISQVRVNGLSATTNLTFPYYLPIGSWV